ncbi:MAG TPA: winged helix-turn-helix domain-containing protein [Acidimicrobiales bacterium]
MDVVLVRWPPERRRREELADLGVPRLLLLEDGHHPPEVNDCLEDWIRVPAPEIDVQSRVATLADRAAAHGATQEQPPHLDDDGVLRAGGNWVPVPPVEARLLRTLLERYGAVVSRESLSRAGWPDRAPDRNVLDVHVLRLRRRIAPVGLAIRTVRSRGYLLESDKRQQGVRNA